MGSKTPPSTSGRCPYCGSDDITALHMRRPDQQVGRCVCGKHSVLSTRTGTRYAVAAPLDPQSEPQL